MKKLFTKIGWSPKDKKATLRWEERKLGGDETVKCELESKDEPEPEFVLALDALRRHSLDVLELPNLYGTGMVVRSVTINHEEDGRRGIVVTSLKTIAQANAPLVLNTPHLREYMDEADDVGFMPDDMRQAMDELIACAERYLGGHRAQASLNLEAAA